MSKKKGVLIVGEFTGDRLFSLSAELLGIGRRLATELAEDLSAVVIGSGAAGVAEEAVSLGADRVYVIDNPLVRDYTNDGYVAAMERLNSCVAPEIILFGHTATSMDLAPRLAFRLETAVTLDCIELSIDPDTKLMLKTKPIYGGNAMAVYTGEGRPQMATIRAKVFEPPERDASRTGEILPFNPALDRSAIRQRVIKKVKEAVSGVRLEEAGFIVCGGRGMGGAEAFEQLADLAGLFNGAMGSTRPPCDFGWVPSHLLIGLTGKLVTPDVYIGVALSGSSQHQAGMSGSKHIIAINRDPEANIFRIAQYGVVGDYKRILPAFIAKCRELLYKGKVGIK